MKNGLFLIPITFYKFSHKHSIVLDDYDARRVNAFSIVLLLTVPLFIYWRVIFHDFQREWDDQWQVINNYTERGWTWANLADIFFSFFWGQYSPVNQLYYTSLYSLAAYNPLSFHLGSIIIHTVNVLLVYLVINKLLKDSPRFEVRSTHLIAFMTSLLFAVHPLMVEAVAWISASKVILCTFFYLASVLFYLKYATTSKSSWFLLSIFCFLLSFGVKEQALTLSFCLLLLDYALKRNLFSKQIWLEKLPFFSLTAIFAIITILSIESEIMSSLFNGNNYPFYENILFGCYALVEYITKLLVPIKLYYLYPFPHQIGDVIPSQYWLYPLIICILIISLWKFWVKPWVFFGVSFFFIHVALVLHIIPLPRLVIIADRYAYLGSVGVFFIIAFAIEGAIFKCKSIKLKLLLFTIALMYPLILGINAYERTKAWKNSDTLKKELWDLIPI